MFLRRRERNECAIAIEKKGGPIHRLGLGARGGGHRDPTVSRSHTGGGGWVTVGYGRDGRRRIAQDITARGDEEEGGGWLTAVTSKSVDSI